MNQSQGDMKIPDEMKDFIRRSSDSEVEKLVLDGLKEFWKSPEQVKEMFGSVPPHLFESVKNLPMTDATLKPIAKMMTQMLIQEVRHGKKLSQKDLEQAVGSAMQTTPSSMPWMSQLLDDYKTRKDEASKLPEEMKQRIQELINTGEDSRRDGDPQSAENQFAEALRLLEEHDPDSASMFSALQHVSIAQLELNNFTEAENNLKRLIKLGERLFSPDYAGIAVGYIGLARVREHQKKNNDADLLYTRAVAIADKSCKDEPNEQADILESAAAFYERQSWFRKSDPLWQRAYEARKKGLGEDNLELAEQAIKFAVSLLDRNKTADAKKWCERGVSIKTRLLPEDHPDLLRTQVLMSDILIAGHELEAAESLLNIVIEHVETTSRDDMLAYPLELLVDIYKETNRLELVPPLEARIATLPQMDEEDVDDESDDQEDD